MDYVRLLATIVLFIGVVNPVPCVKSIVSLNIVDLTYLLVNDHLT